LGGCGDLDDHRRAASNRLDVQVSPVEVADQAASNIFWLYISVIDSLIHKMDYNQITKKN
jgi:hypothetical protein